MTRPSSSRVAALAALAAVALSAAARPAGAQSTTPATADRPAAGEPAATSAAVWTLVTADLRSEPVALKAFGPDGAKVVPTSSDAAAERAVPAAQFVELSRSLAATARTGRYDLHLVGGDRLNGAPLRVVNDEAIAWTNPVAGEVLVPLRLVAGVTEAGKPLPTDRRKDDVLTLANGDRVTGTIVDLTPEKVTIVVGTQNVTIDFARTVSVVLAAAAQTGKEKPYYRVRLDEGSVLVSPTVTVAGDKLEVTSGGKARPVDLARVSLVEQVNGPVAFLANRLPSANVFAPYFGSSQRFLARMHTDFEGEPIRFNDRAVPRSIATHSYSKLSWPLDGSYVAFRTRYAMDPKAGSDGDVTVRIKLDDKVVHEQKNVRPRVMSPPVVIDLGSARTLTLEVDYGRFADANDRLNWLEPALLKQKPAGAAGSADAAGPR
ncbi:MAG TPA: NPCBM/NEW2 domain-containing protein [Humisphaera sp.]